MSCDPSKTCQICDQTGLPILPLRYAVARKDAAVDEPAPELQAPFGAGVTDIALPADQAHYTLRQLRAGYLYVFNEVRGEWKAYVVSDDAYLLEFDIHQPPPDLGDAQPCARMARSAAGRCIMVPDAARAGALWLGFSDTAWTPAVLDKHRHQAFREKHMQRIDVGAWAAAGTPQPHLDKLETLGERVCEFFLAPPMSALACSADDPPQVDQPADGTIQLQTITVVGKRYWSVDFSLHYYNNHKPEGPAFIAAATTAAGELVPAMVAIDDPVGITMDLATLMAVRLQEFMERDDLRRPLAISTLVRSLETAIRQQGELALIRGRQAVAVDDLKYWKDIPLYGGGFGVVDQNRLRMAQQHRDSMRCDAGYRAEWNAKVADAKQAAAAELTGEDLAEAAENSWDRYRDQLREGQPKQWLSDTYQPALEDFDRQCIVPLARTHKKWMLSTPLLESFDCNHDDADPRSGEGFADTLMLCIQDTQQNKISFDLYAGWLRASTMERGNLVLRAMQYNQKAIIEQINSAVGGGVDKSALSQVPWDNLIRLYDQAEQQLAQNGNAAARVLVAVAGPGFQALNAALDDTAGAFLVSLGVMGKAPITHVRHVGTVSEAIEKFVEAVQKANPAFAQVDQDLMRQHFEIRSRGLRQTTQTRNAAGRWAASDVQIRLDRFKLAQVSDDLVQTAPAAALDRAGDAILRMDEWPSNEMSRWKTMTSGSLKLGFIQAFLQLFALHGLGKELDEASPQERGEKEWRYGAAAAGAFGGVLEVAETAVANSIKLGASLGRLGGRVSLLLRVGGRLFGLGAALITAVLDGKQFVQELREGDYGMAGLYAVSAASGVLSFALLAGWGGAGAFLGLAATGWGLILLAVFVAVAFLISYFHENDLQEWMEQCWFGENASFSDLEAELTAFEVATRPDPDERAAIESDTALQAGCR